MCKSGGCLLLPRATYKHKNQERLSYKEFSSSNWRGDGQTDSVPGVCNYIPPGEHCYENWAQLFIASLAYELVKRSTR